jgi:hypothetical protein
VFELKVNLMDHSEMLAEYSFILFVKEDYVVWLTALPVFLEGYTTSHRLVD